LWQQEKYKYIQKLYIVLAYEYLNTLCLIRQLTVVYVCMTLKRVTND